MRKILAVLTVFLITASVVLAQSNWIEDYKLALENLKKQDLISALYFLDRAVNEHDRPILDQKDSTGKTIDYLPYYYLGVIYYNFGKYSLALNSFDLSQKYGLIKKRPVLYDNLKKYTLFVNNKLILKMAKEPAKLPVKEEEKIEARKKYLQDEYDLTSEKPAEKPVISSDEQSLVYAVRKELGLPNEPIGIYPWYFYYERSIKYLEEGQWDESMLYMTEALLRKPFPKKNARRYGVWFKDYTPYLYLSYCAFKQDNKIISVKAFEISEKYKAYDEDNEIYIKVRNMINK